MIITITAGEPAGIGPDILIQLAQQGLDPACVVIADGDLLLSRAQQLNCPLSLIEYEPTQQPRHKQGQITFIHVPIHSSVTAGVIDTRNSQYVLDTLDLAIDLCLKKDSAALVTGPLHKQAIMDGGHPAFTGHTEYLADKTKAPLPVMVLANSQLRVALQTIHCPLSDVSKRITPDALEKTIRVLHHDLQSVFQISDPHIVICGLNPHAGEFGKLGLEEINIIEPTIESLKQEGLRLTGPLPADTLFAQYRSLGADAALAMYHDQGLPIVKFADFYNTVNITLGLPIIRTSVDHGTALSLAGTGRSIPDSLAAAINLALTLSKAHHDA